MNEQQTLQAVQEAIGYRFSDPSLLLTALTHASSTDSRVNSNERLEFLGDAILGVVVCTKLFESFPEYLEGELTKIKSAVVSRRTCARVARDLGLHQYLVLGKGMSGRAQLPDSLAAAALEAVIAAVYLDCRDLNRVRDFILDTTSKYIREASESAHQRNFKSQLQQYAQQALGATPNYELLDEKGPDHSKCFEISVVIRGHRYGSAWGPSKKEAEQKAAYTALQELEALDPSEEYEPELETG